MITNGKRNKKYIVQTLCGGNPKEWSKPHLIVTSQCIQVFVQRLLVGSKLIITERTDTQIPTVISNPASGSKRYIP